MNDESVSSLEMKRRELRRRESRMFSDEVVSLQYPSSSYSYRDEFTPIIGYTEKKLIAYFIPSQSKIAYFERKEDKITPVNNKQIASSNYDSTKNLLHISEDVTIEEFIAKTLDKWSMLHPRYSWIQDDIYDRIAKNVVDVSGYCNEANSAHYLDLFSEKVCEHCGEEITQEQKEKLEVIDGLLR